MKIDKGVDVKAMKKEIKMLEKQGLKEGVDFDVIVKEEGETDEEMTDKLLANRFMRQDLIEIGNIGKNMHRERERLLKRIIEINEKLGKEFNTTYGLGGNKSNLDYAVSLDDHYLISKEILRGHPFIDGNKRTAFMVFMILTTKKSYEEILKDLYDIFLSLSK